jgi:hypothetical protein
MHLCFKSCIKLKTVHYICFVIWDAHAGWRAVPCTADCTLARQRGGLAKPNIGLCCPLEQDLCLLTCRRRTYSRPSEDCICRRFLCYLPFTCIRLSTSSLQGPLRNSPICCRTCKTRGLRTTRGRLKASPFTDSQFAQTTTHRDGTDGWSRRRISVATWICTCWSNLFTMRHTTQACRCVSYPRDVCAATVVAMCCRSTGDSRHSGTNTLPDLCQLRLSCGEHLGCSCIIGCRRYIDERLTITMLE